MKFILLLKFSGLNIAELAHMEDEEDQDQDTVKAKLAGGAKPGDANKRPSMDDRRKSLDKSVTLTRQAADSNKNLTGTEAREEGNVGWEVYKQYFGSGGGWPVIGVLVLLFALEQVIDD